MCVTSADARMHCRVWTELPALEQPYTSGSLGATPRMIASFCLAVICLAIIVAGENTSGQDTHNALEWFQLHNVRHALDEGIQLGFSHATLAASGQWIDVSWSGVQDPQDDDYIALYAPANVSVYHTSPIKYKWAVSAPSHRKEGAGAVRYSAPDCKHAGIQSQMGANPSHLEHWSLALFTLHVAVAGLDCST